MKQKGFTLIELAVVVSIILIIAVIAIPKMSAVKNSTNSVGDMKNSELAQQFLERNYNVMDDGQTTASGSASVLYNKMTAENEMTTIKNPYYKTSTGVSAVQSYDGTQADTPAPVGNTAVVIYSCEQSIPTLP